MLSVGTGRRRGGINLSAEKVYLAWQVGIIASSICLYGCLGFNATHSVFLSYVQRMHPLITSFFWALIEEKETEGFLFTGGNSLVTWARCWTTQSPKTSDQNCSDPILVSVEENTTSYGPVCAMHFVHPCWFISLSKLELQFCGTSGHLYPRRLPKPKLLLCLSSVWVCLACVWARLLFSNSLSHQNLGVGVKWGQNGSVHSRNTSQ